MKLLQARDGAEDRGQRLEIVEKQVQVDERFEANHFGWKLLKLVDGQDYLLQIVRAHDAGPEEPHVLAQHLQCGETPEIVLCSASCLV